MPLPHTISRSDDIVGDLRVHRYHLVSERSRCSLGYCRNRNNRKLDWLIHVVPDCWLDDSIAGSHFQKIEEGGIGDILLFRRVAGVDQREPPECSATTGWVAWPAKCILRAMLGPFWGQACPSLHSLSVARELDRVLAGWLVPPLKRRVNGALPVRPFVINTVIRHVS